MLFLLPPEVRHMIYSLVFECPTRSLDSVVAGLFLSGKQIKCEMEDELEHRVQAAALKVPGKMIVLGSSPPAIHLNSFVTLSRVELNIPRQILKPFRGQRSQLEHLGPVFASYLRQLILYISEDEKSHGPVTQYRVQTGMYRTRTTRDLVGPFAVRLTCLICPDICSHDDHNPETRELCLAPGQNSNPGPWVVNVMSVALHIRGLDDWRPLFRGAPGSNLDVSPTQDRAPLSLRGWELCGEENGSEFLDSEAPDAIIWKLT
ncbi:hypothetical protein C7974DRAFT_381314 [Boeremia exigua]|uniref:uncharacterized protein n=1 Tax=Boeremia exigua TaxID=749465 RepID=UPI001E8E596E|nr:uncharacterized protein C7974DRAFT_381314 [Boeremia exigua]KAH6611831.1 hypothetical protein C7974DRAFT_381314 [Boeremia exigua]